jgi:hypothetical protein
LLQHSKEGDNINVAIASLFFCWNATKKATAATLPLDFFVLVQRS